VNDTLATTTTNATNAAVDPSITTSSPTTTTSYSNGQDGYSGFGSLFSGAVTAVFVVNCFVFF